MMGKFGIFNDGVHSASRGERKNADCDRARYNRIERKLLCCFSAECRSCEGKVKQECKYNYARLRSKQKEKYP